MVWWLNEKKPYLRPAAESGHDEEADDDDCSSNNDFDQWYSMSNEELYNTLRSVESSSDQHNNILAVLAIQHDWDTLYQQITISPELCSGKGCGGPSLFRRMVEGESTNIPSKLLRLLAFKVPELWNSTHKETHKVEWDQVERYNLCYRLSLCNNTDGLKTLLDPFELIVVDFQEVVAGSRAGSVYPIHFIAELSDDYVLVEYVTHFSSVANKLLQLVSTGDASGVAHYACTDKMINILHGLGVDIFALNTEGEQGKYINDPSYYSVSTNRPAMMEKVLFNTEIMEFAMRRGHPSLITEEEWKTWFVHGWPLDAIFHGFQLILRQRPQTLTLIEEFSQMLDCTLARIAQEEEKLGRVGNKNHPLVVELQRLVYGDSRHQLPRFSKAVYNVDITSNNAATRHTDAVQRLLAKPIAGMTGLAFPEFVDSVHTAVRLLNPSEHLVALWDDIAVEEYTGKNDELGTINEDGLEGILPKTFAKLGKRRSVDAEDDSNNCKKQKV